MTPSTTPTETELNAALFLCQKELGTRTKELAEAFLARASEPQALSSVPEQVRKKLVRTKEFENTVRFLEDLRSAGVTLLPICSEEYPARLKQIEDPPLILFARGNLECLNNSKALAIVGSRKADPAGCEIALQLAQGLASCGVCVISGLALGVDAAAHRGALRSFSATPTVAVLGNGLPEIYPRSNESLARDILSSGGLIVSQFLPHEPAFPANFLNRNRIIAALAEGVLVVQASKRSGSLVTARYALEQGKELMAVPGAITEERYRGSNELIKQGAFLVTGLEDILDIFEHYKQSSANSDELEQPISTNSIGLPCDPISNLSSIKKKILSKLQERDSWSFDELQQAVDSEDFISELFELELQSQALRLPGNIITTPRKL